MIDKKKLQIALGHPFCSKKDALRVLGVKDYDSVKPFFSNVPRLGRQYYTDDVIANMISCVEYDD